MNKDRFLIIGCSTLNRDLLFRRLKMLNWPDGEEHSRIEILAPVEEVEVKRRPRRRKKGDAAAPVKKVKEQPIFFNYVAIGFDALEDHARWKRLFRTRGVWFVLMQAGLNEEDAERPLLVTRDRLGGFNAGQGFEKWEGFTVAFVHGPFVGQTGTFVDGFVEIGGMRVKASYGELTKI